MRTNIIFLFLALNSFSFLGNNQIIAQEVFSITAGLGFPECHHLGFRAYIDQLQIGVGIGTNLNEDGENSIIYSTDVLGHFGKLTDWSDKRPWYVRCGLNFYRTESSSSINTWTLFNFRIGRELWVSKKLSFGIDAGFIIEVHHKKVRKTPTRSSIFDINIDTPLLPGGSIVMIYHI